MTKKGKFIVFYGTNNLGKTSQAKILLKKLNELGIKAEYLKYPLYQLEPSGSMIDSYLRKNNPFNLSAREAQLLYLINRAHYQETLKNKLKNGIYIIAEDYIGTGIAWGLGAGVDLEFLEKINSFLIKEDLAILFDGERFEEAIEKNHKHETNNELMKKVRQIHLDLGKKYNWKKINANLKIEEVAKLIFSEVKKII